MRIVAWTGFLFAGAIASTRDGGPNQVLEQSSLRRVASMTTPPARCSNGSCIAVAEKRNRTDDLRYFIKMNKTSCDSSKCCNFNGEAGNCPLYFVALLRVHTGSGMWQGD